MTKDNRTNAVVVTRKKSEHGGLALKGEILNSGVVPEDCLDANAMQAAAGSTNVLIAPLYPYALLRQLIRESGTLPTCIDALANNVANTGYDTLKREKVDANDGTKPDDKAKAIQTFFNTVWPGQDGKALIKSTVRDLESVGRYYWEVIRSSDGDIMLLKGIKPDNLRPVKHSETDKITKTIKLMRNGKEVSIPNFEVYERRFARVHSLSTGNKTVYFKEFGATRELNRRTGEWVTDKSALQALTLGDRATELIEFKLEDNGAPRWIAEIRSVLGEQEAADLNLEFFNNGGIPPVVFALLGGQMTPDSRQRFEDVLTGKAKDKLAAALIEIYSTGGSLDKEVPAKLEVHKFGAESANDALFTKYIADCAARIRRRWRLPAILTGDAAEMSYATAFVSYMIAEEQVFGPMRGDLYDRINATLLQDASMGGGEYVLKPRPLMVKDTKQMQVAIDNAKKEKAIDKEEYLRQLNALLSLDMVLTTEEDQPQTSDGSDLDQVDTTDPAGDGNSRTDVGSLTQQGVPAEAPRDSAKAEKLENHVEAVLALATQVAACVVEGSVVTPELVEKMDTLRAIDGGNAAFRHAFTAQILSAGAGTAAAGLVERAGCCGG